MFWYIVATLNPPSRHHVAGRQGCFWAALSLDADYEEFFPPRAIRLALSHPLWALARLTLMVALLYGADIAAVYPLLKILFYNENCQQWVVHQIETQAIEVRKIDARLAEVEFLTRVRETWSRPQ